MGPRQPVPAGERKEEEAALVGALLLGFSLHAATAPGR